MPPEIVSPVESSASPAPAPVPVPASATAATFSTSHPQEQGLRSSSVAVAATPPPGRGTKMDIIPPYRPRDPKYRPLPDYPSPGGNHDTSPKFQEDKQILLNHIQDSLPASVRAAVRKHWGTTLVGSDWHQGFVLNVVINRVSPVVMQRTVVELAHIITAGSAKPLLDCFNVKDFDDNAETILRKASNDFLDKALAKRLETISAPALINALARAERLGYDQSDILEQKNERVIGSLPSLSGPFNGQKFPPPAHPHGATPVTSQPVPSQASQGQPPSRVPPDHLRCQNCAVTFPGRGMLEAHLASRSCYITPAKTNSTPAQWVCSMCNKAFTTPGGLKYHEMNRVCENDQSRTAAPPSTAPPAVASSGSAMQGINPTATPYVPSTQPPYQYQAVSTPAQKGPLITANPAYSHLTPDAKASLEQELRQAEANYSPRFKEAEANPDPTQRKKTLANLHNSFSTKQSTIRKKYGVSLRIRRSRAEIDAQQDRMGLAAQSSDADDTPAKRQRTANGGFRSPSVMSNTPIPPPPQPRVAVAEMSSGLGTTSNATVATTDPTSSFTSVNRLRPDSTPTQQPPQADNSLSSLQKKGYRVSSHMGSRSPALVTSDLGSKGEPISLDGSDASDSDSGDSGDEEIPASLPR